MIKPSDLSRSVGKFLSDQTHFSEFVVVADGKKLSKIKNANTAHVYPGQIEAYGGGGQLGSSSWAYTVVIDIYLPQNQQEDHDDGPVGDAVVALGEALPGAEIRMYRNGEDRTGTFVTPSAIKIDLTAGPAARFEIGFELSG